MRKLSSGFVESGLCAWLASHEALQAGPVLRLIIGLSHDDQIVGATYKTAGQGGQKGSIERADIDSRAALQPGVVRHVGRGALSAELINDVQPSHNKVTKRRLRASSILCR